MKGFADLTGPGQPDSGAGALAAGMVRAGGCLGWRG